MVELSPRIVYYLQRLIHLNLRKGFFSFSEKGYTVVALLDVTNSASVSFALQV